MATANEVLEQMEQHPELYASADVCIVDPVTRTISVPDAYRILGVESDESVKVVPFQCPKMVEDDVDLTDFTLYINYVNAGGDFGIYSIENVKESGENITFDWIIRRSVTARRGTIRFILCAKRSDDEGNIIQEWNTTINDECESLEGLEGAPSIADQFPDIIQQILEKLQEIIDGGGGTGGPVDQEQIQQAVNDYLTKNPPSGMNTEQQQQLTKNTNDIADLKSALPDKLDTNQGVENKGKSMVVGEDGGLVPEYIKNGIDVEYIPEDEMLVLSGGSKNTDETPESPGPITNDIELLDTIILTPSQKQINKNLDEYNKKEYFVLVDVPKTENETYFRIGIGNMYSLQTPHACNIYSSQIYAIIHKIDKNYYGFATMNDGWSGGEVTTGIISTPRTEEKYLALSFYPYVSGDEEATIKIYGR